MNNIPLDTVCRCCLSKTDEMRNIGENFVEPDFVFEPEITYSDAIYLCTNIRCNSQDDNLQTMYFPHSICTDCLQKLRVAIYFRAKCEETDEFLRKQLGNIDVVSGESITIAEIEEHSEILTENVINAPVNSEQYIISYEIASNAVITEENTIPAEKIQEINETSPKKATPMVNEITVIRNMRNKRDSTATKLPEIHKNWFECEHCKKGFNLKQNLVKHIEFTHNGRTLHLCNICGQMCSSESSLKTHILKHQEKKYKCNLCTKSFFTKKGYEAHQGLHSNPTMRKKFLCSTCGKSFTTRQRLKIHTFTHTGEKNYACDLCDKMFATESRLRSHRRIHTGERPYICGECGLTFAQGNALKCHKRIHTGEKPYECNVCGKRFTQNTILKTHMTLHTGKTVKCPDCDKKFSRASYLILHRREHTGERPYACDFCTNRYKQKSHLDRHLDTHLGVKYKCDICTKEYSKQWSLKIHMFTHSDKKPFDCEHCAFKFTRKDKYKTHLKTVHGLELPNLSKNVQNVAQEAPSHVKQPDEAEKQ